ncbi:hypothetical protein HMPREF0072_1061 [Anaerococcus lactolyticus ATCC 51172]|uniref:Uncharacterized protein n=1 Tax=Anaerococcus lactolyticus ATCC 51172 TaxID=525254 RepID=C2BFE1_9FIRM|nr:hypothetical protein HMPREF0072_1061 [Anaerococcus lactolyticus ATCC 51172]
MLLNIRIVTSKTRQDQNKRVVFYALVIGLFLFSIKNKNN